jgi:hypothetical protein
MMRGEAARDEEAPRMKGIGTGQADGIWMGGGTGTDGKMASVTGETSAGIGMDEIAAGIGIGETVAGIGMANPATRTLMAEPAAAGGEAGHAARASHPPLGGVIPRPLRNRRGAATRAPV